jgi:hypothetical protein
MGTPSPMSAWKFKTQHAQAGLDILNNTSGTVQDFISAESIVLAAGPAKKPNDLTKVFPIGLCDSVGVQQNKNIIQLFEIGSKLPYLLPGRTFIQLQLNRVVFNGDSLLGALTRGVNDFDETTTADIDSPGLLEGNTLDEGEGHFYLNLASTFFNKSFGLAIFVQDSDVDDATGAAGEGEWVTAFYAENCLVQSHQMNIQGQQYIVMESAMIRCTNLIPLNVKP